MSTPTGNHYAQSGLTLRERGAAVVEMAILLPVLVICFWGVAEIGQYVMMSERMTKTVNQLSAVLYTLRPSDLQASGPFGSSSANNVIGAAIREAQTLARPFRAPTITVRYCQRRQSDGAIEQIYFGKTVPQIAGCSDGPGCQDTALTQKGYGAYVQVYSCQKFQSALTPYYFKNVNSDVAMVKQVAFIPLTDTNQTALIKKAGGVSIDDNTILPVTCVSPLISDGNGGCKAANTTCKAPKLYDKSGNCVDQQTCAIGYEADGYGGCKAIVCGTNMTMQNGKCTDNCMHSTLLALEIKACVEKRCPPESGTRANQNGGCDSVCNANATPPQTWSTTYKQCVTTCNTGFEWDAALQPPDCVQTQTTCQGELVEDHGSCTRNCSIAGQTPNKARYCSDASCPTGMYTKVGSNPGYWVCK